jgi:hypothetical protein
MFLFVCFGGTGVWTQCLMFARQVLYHLWVLHFCPGPASDLDPSA